MQKFKGLKELDLLIQDAKKNGWNVDTTDFDKGGDWIWLRDLIDRVLQIKLNTVNGTFYVYAPEKETPIATHLSSDLDTVDWYKEILDLIYEPL